MRISLSSTKGFTLVEIAIASTISSIVVAALFAIVLASLKMYYVNSDYIEVGGKTRRLIDDMLENGTLDDTNTDFKDLAIFNDISDLTLVPPDKKGDVLMFFTRIAQGPGNISRFTCYYLKKGPADGSNRDPVSIWRFVGTPTSATKDAAVALGNCTKNNDKQVSGTIFNGSFPRAAGTSAAPREGIFTNQGVGGVGNSQTVLVNLPTNMSAHGTGPVATSNVTIAITPRH